MEDTEGLYQPETGPAQSPGQQLIHQSSTGSKRYFPGMGQQKPSGKTPAHGQWPSGSTQIINKCEKAAKSCEDNSYRIGRERGIEAMGAPVDLIV